jgi:hypothetical protein
MRFYFSGNLKLLSFSVICRNVCMVNGRFFGLLIVVCCGEVDYTFFLIVWWVVGRNVDELFLSYHIFRIYDQSYKALKWKILTVWNGKF